jgi:hypothetical protein
MSWRSRCWPRVKGKADWKHYTCGPVFLSAMKGAVLCEGGGWHVNPFVRAVGDVDKLTAVVADTWNVKRGKPRWMFPVVGGYYVKHNGYDCRHQMQSLVELTNRQRGVDGFERGKRDRRLWGQYVGLAKWGWLDDGRVWIETVASSQEKAMLVNAKPGWFFGQTRTILNDCARWDDRYAVFVRSKS